MIDQAPLNELKAFLARLPEGSVEEDLREPLTALMANAWHFFEVRDEDSIEGQHFLSDQDGQGIEAPTWIAPTLTFRIEHNGRFEFGPTRINVHRWEVNFASRAAKIVGTSYRQKRPLSPRYNALEAVMQIIEFLSSDKSASDPPKGLIVLSADHLKVAVTEFVPSGYADTTLRRRKRFVSRLIEDMERAGWRFSGCKRDRQLKFEKNARTDTAKF